MSNPAPPPGFLANEDPAEDTALDPAFILRLVRQLIPSNGQQKSCQQPLELPTTQDASPRDSLEEAHSGTPNQQEDAGCILWDLSTSEGSAEFLIRHQLLELLPLVLQDALSSGKLRLVEILIGVLGNLACHTTALQQLSQTPSILQEVTREVMWLEDPACLSEACRLVSTAIMAESRTPWLQSLQEAPNVLLRLIWIVQNTLNETLLQRGLNLLVALACQGSSILDMLISLGLLPTALGPLRTLAAFLDQASVSPSRQSGHDPGGRSSSAQVASDQIPSKRQASRAAQINITSMQQALQQHTASAHDGSHREDMQGAARLQQHANHSEASDPHLTADDGEFASEASTQQPVTTAIADSALRILEAVAIDARHAVRRDLGVPQLLLQLLQSCDSPEVSESVVAVMTALESEEITAAIAQDPHMMRQVLSTLHCSQLDLANTCCPVEEPSATLQLVSVAAPRIATAPACKLAEVLNVLADFVPRSLSAANSTQHLWLSIVHQAMASAHTWLAVQSPSASAEDSANCEEPFSHQHASVGCCCSAAAGIVILHVVSGLNPLDLLNSP
ncbi:hypothetical protein WJX74_010917 [Apatococcus lobatus]|uniref:Uncharacterized protein n=1 Tax=Apatococcus lobatus TaxID=904363 RepID=A0AAW1QKS0_9CHLO